MGDNTPEKNEKGINIKITDEFAFPHVNVGKLYTADEDKILIECIDKNQLIKEIGGNSMWKFLEHKNILPGRSWQSMKNRFVRTVICKKLYNQYLSPKVAESWLNYFKKRNLDQRKNTPSKPKPLKKTFSKQFPPGKENSKKTSPTNNSQLNQPLSSQRLISTLFSVEKKNILSNSLSSQKTLPKENIPTVETSRGQNTMPEKLNNKVSELKSTTFPEKFAFLSLSSIGTFPKENIPTAGTSRDQNSTPEKSNNEASSKNIKRRITSNNFKNTIENACKEKVLTKKKDSSNNKSSEIRGIMELISESYTKHIELGKSFKIKNRYRHFVRSISHYLKYARQLLECDEEGECGNDTEDEECDKESERRSDTEEDDVSGNSIRLDESVNKLNFSDKSTQTQNEENHNVNEEQRKIINCEQVECLEKRELFIQPEAN